MVQKHKEKVQQETPVVEQSHSGKNKREKFVKRGVESMKQHVKMTSPNSIPLFDTSGESEKEFKYHKKRHDKKKKV